MWKLLHGQPSVLKKTDNIRFNFTYSRYCIERHAPKLNYFHCFSVQPNTKFNRNLSSSNGVYTRECKNTRATLCLCFIYFCSENAYKTFSMNSILSTPLDGNAVCNTQHVYGHTSWFSVVQLLSYNFNSMEIDILAHCSSAASETKRNWGQTSWYRTGRTGLSHISGAVSYFLVISDNGKWKYWERSLHRCHFIQYETDIRCCRIVAGTPRWAYGNQRPEQCP